MALDDNLPATAARQGALAYTDHTIASLSVGQAAGTDTILAANTNRVAIFINPNADGRLYFTGNAAADGPYYNLYAGVPFVRTGPECPTGALYVTGQTAATKLRIGEA